MMQKCALAAVVCAILFVAAAPCRAAGKVDFRRDVQPIFKAHCYDCHGPSLQMNGFRLDRRRDAMKGGTLAMIGPGNSAASRMYLKLIGNQYGPQMPPTGPLKAEQIEIIKNWIDEGAEWPDDVSGEAPATKPEPRATRLMESLRKGDIAGFKKLLAADPGAAKLKGPGGSTPLMYAALYADAASMRLLLDKGADANAANDAGATALMWAADDADKTRLLLAHGANVNAKSQDGRTPLITASGIFGNGPVVKLLLERGAKVDVKAPALFGETSPLLEAAYAGDEASIRMLVEHGANPAASGPGALAFAMRARCAGCMDMFMKDAKPDLLIPAMFLVSPPLGPGLGVKPLLERVGVAGAKDPAGNSILPLVAASDAFPVDSVKALLDRGADVNSTTAAGETALELASRHGRTPVVDLLIKAGARQMSSSVIPDAPARPAASIRAAVERSLPLVQSNDATFLRKSGCVSCHNNSLTAVTLATARKNGFRVDEQEARDQLKTIGAYIEQWRERLLQGQGIPGDTDTVGYILLGLAAANYAPDPATDAMARFIKCQQLPDGHWRTLANRPPLESSPIEVTAVAMRSLQTYSPRANRAEYEKAIKRAGDWLAEAEAVSTEDKAFQVLGLIWAEKSRQAVQKAAASLLAEQRSDGGWAQIPTRDSDAYATGEALVALQQSGALAPSDPACKRGLDFLLKTQAEDGSWYVRRRAIPIQPFFESGFPYGRDQFISASATNWAATALALAARPAAASSGAQ